MKSFFRFAGTVSAVVVMAAATGCATGPSGDKMGMMDMKTMCEMHAKMKDKSPEEKQAMMGEHMKMMSPEKMQEHMAMMQEKCK